MKALIFIVLLYINIYIGYAGDCNFSICKVDDGLKTEWEHNIKETIINIVLHLLTLLGIIWTIFVIKWWASILISAWDEEKKKKWIKTIIYALIWTFIIISAYTITSSIFIGSETI